MNTSQKTETMNTPIEIGDRRELFVDDYLIATLAGGAQRRLHHPVPGQIVMTRDQPWEGNLCSCDCLFHDGDKFRLYYRAMQVETSEDLLEIPHVPVICYAESTDGIHWTKPDLGLVEFNGSKHNNIVLTSGIYNGGGGEEAGVVTVFRDENPAVAAGARYKALALSNEPENFGLLPLKSSDGIHFTKMSDKAVIRQGKFDSQNLAFWDETRSEYRAYYRDPNSEGYRWIRTATSPDFINWTEHPLIEFPGDAAANVEHYYVNQVQAVLSRAAHFPGFPPCAISNATQWSLSRLFPDLEKRRQRASASTRFGTALTDTLLMSSRDGQNFQRWAEAFIAPGPQRPDTWSYNSAVVAWQMIETPSDLKGAANEITFLVNEGAWIGASCQLPPLHVAPRWFRFRRSACHGRRSRHQTARFSGQQTGAQLRHFRRRRGARLNCRTPRARPFPAMHWRKADPSSAIRPSALWNGKPALMFRRFRASRFRLRLALRDADLYAFQFAP